MMSVMMKNPGETDRMDDIKRTETEKQVWVDVTCEDEKRNIFNDATNKKTKMETRGRDD